VSDSNSRGPMWCAPHIEGQYLRDEITKIVQKDPKGWFHDVYALLEKHEIAKEQRVQFYQHAQAVEDKRRYHDRKDG